MQKLKENFWKYVSFILFLTSCTLLIMWKTESYGRKMDAEVSRIKLELAIQSHATGSSTLESILIPKAR